MADPNYTNGPTVPVEQFGKDHWSTFAYAECRAVDHDGWIERRHMRGHMAGWERYPTLVRNADGTVGQVPNHNDYHCLADLEAAGLLTFERGTRRDDRGEIVALTHRVALTPLGQVIAGKLRAHKANGGYFHGFDPGPTAGWWAAPRSEVTV